ncbi:MAG: fluoride efflux transporter CrcB [Acidobacteria bacterium]|nr:MAG: fluoride efflux transporter CrcB [Acidobacteriota bacterium]
MSRSIIFVAVGGMIGSICRFLSVPFIVGFLPFRFPFGTFAVNLIGSFIMGAAVGMSERFAELAPEWRIFVTAGFCGGFTTFSAFAFENVELLLNKHYGTFAAYAIVSFALCVAVAMAGFLITRP